MRQSKPSLDDRDDLRRVVLFCFPLPNCARPCGAAYRTCTSHSRFLFNPHKATGASTKLQRQPASQFATAAKHQQPNAPLARAYYPTP
jgi:hypothetical protein